MVNSTSTCFPDYENIQTIGPDEDGLVQVVLNRPEARNAINPQMHRELTHAFELLRRPRDVGAVLLRGEGKSFSVGGDVSVIRSYSAGPGAEHEVVEEAAAMVYTFLSVGPPVVSAIQGHAIGLGATIALLGDIIMMADDAVIADTHVKAGLVAGDGGSFLWPLLMGPNNAKQYLLTGDKLDAENAYRLGLANRVLAADDLLPESLTLARRLACGPRTAVAWTKLAINARILAEATMHMPLSLAHEARSMHLPDMVEGTTAFLEKRAPRWPSCHPTADRRCFMTTDHQAITSKAIDDSPSGVEEFRIGAAKWLADNVPANWRTELDGASETELTEFQRWWLRKLHSGGYAVPHWPAEFGGVGASTAEQIALRQEMARADAPELPMFFVSLNHASAALIKHGTPEQRDLLARMLDGEVWCQGFSEPNAGSDLASLSTRAERQGDSYVINGQKVWSSHAKQSRWCLLLARTDPNVAKRSGISLFILDLELDGVDVRPIRTITGQTEFCEIFLTDVSVSASQLVGGEGEGWSVAQTMLSTERGSALLQFAEGADALLHELVHVADQSGISEDGHTRQLIGEAQVKVEILRLLSERTSAMVAAGTDGPIDASILKVYYSDLVQWLTGLGLEFEGLPAMRLRASGPNDFEATGLWLIDYLTSWRWTIAAGTNEIQRTLIGERGLGLPR